MNSFGNTTKTKQNIWSFWWSQKCWFSLLPQTGLIKIMTMTLILGHCAGDLHTLFRLVIPAAYWGRSKDPQVKDKEIKVEQNQRFKGINGARKEKPSFLLPLTLAFVQLPCPSLFPSSAVCLSLLMAVDILTLMYKHKVFNINMGHTNFKIIICCLSEIHI